MASKSTKTTSDISKDDQDKLKTLISQEVKRKINEQIGLSFEENIRGLLKYSFNLKESSIPRNIKYRTIEIENENLKRFALDYFESKIIINGKDYNFILNEDFSISILEYKTNKFIEFVENNKEKIIKTINGKKLTFFRHIEIEVDGIFELDKAFNILKFSSKNFSVIFSNIEKDEANFEYAIIESKLDKNKISDIITQIEKDSLLFEPLLNKKCIFMGFINSENVKTYNYAKKLKNIKCIIFGLKGPKICGKYMTRPIDWDIEEKIQTIKNNIKDLKKDIKDVKDDIKDVKDDIKDILTLLNECLPKISPKINTILGKKRNRSKTPSKERRMNK